MAPNSTSSSMDAQNGSAYSNGAYAAGAADVRNQPRRQPTWPSAAAYNRRDRNSGTNDDASTEQTPPSSDEYASTPATDGGYSNHGPHHFPAYDPETPRYENELTLEEEHNNIPAPSTPPRNGYTERSPTPNDAHPNVPANGEHSPTTKRWSAEFSPEERMRVGLPRYESEEQKRQAYGAAVDYESRRTH